MHQLTTTMMTMTMMMTKPPQQTQFERSVAKNSFNLDLKHRMLLLFSIVVVFCAVCSFCAQCDVSQLKLENWRVSSKCTGGKATLIEGQGLQLECTGGTAPDQFIMFSTLQGTKYNFDFYGIFGNFSGTGNFSVYLGARDPTETIEYPLGGGIHRLNFTYGLVAAATQYPKIADAAGLGFDVTVVGGYQNGSRAVVVKQARTIANDGSLDGLTSVGVRPFFRIVGAGPVKATLRVFSYDQETAGVDFSSLLCPTTKLTVPPSTASSLNALSLLSMFVAPLMALVFA